MKTDYDIIIIGSGAGGGTLARLLAPSGKSVLILERGGWLKRELENWNAEEVVQNAAFGVGPLQASAKLTLASIYGWTTLFALGLAALALLIVAETKGAAR